MRRRAHIVAIGAGAALLTFAGAPSAGARLHTSVTVFHAFTPTGEPTIPVRHASGSCFTGSLATSRADGWRCLVGNVLYDPCFSSAAAPGVVICPNQNPARGTEIRLTKGLPSAQANGGSASAAGRPWAIELFDGAHCVLAGGATAVVHGVRLNYFCDGHGKNGLWGSPRRTTDPWTILSAPFAATTLSRRVAVLHVWT